MAAVPSTEWPQSIASLQPVCSGYSYGRSDPDCEEREVKSTTGERIKTVRPFSFHIPNVHFFLCTHLIAEEDTVLHLGETPLTGWRYQYCCRYI